MIVAIGDIHGEFKKLTRDIRCIVQDNAPITFVQIGDFGLGFESYKYEYRCLSGINSALVSNDSQLYVIRGNHDDPKYWTDGNRYVLSNIHFVTDDTFLELDGRNCFFAGGALSIDRVYRRPDISYWESEAYVHTNVPSGTPPIDVLFTHDVPHSVSSYTLNSPYVEGFAKLDSTLMADLTESQRQLELLLSSVMATNPSKLKVVHGHYHESHTTHYDNVTTISLGTFEFKEIL